MTDLATRYGSSLMNAFGAPRRILVHGEGCHVFDDTGKRYVDLLAGLAVNSLGHGHRAVVETMAQQATILGHVSNFFATPPQIALAERLLQLLDAGPGKVFLTNSGAEANETALKITRRTGRSQIVAAEGGFHGRTMGALSLTSKASYRTPFAPLLDDVVFVPFGDEAALAAAVSPDTAAILLEPIQGEAGVVVPPDGYLSAARRIASRNGALLWVDEVQTGVGRTGRWFAFQQEGIRPDLVTVAKGLGAGFPIGACVGLGDAGDLLQPGSHGTTFGGNPLAAAVALTVLTVIEREDLLGRMPAVSMQLAQIMRSIPGAREVRGRGLLLAAQLDQPHASALTGAALEAGVIVNDCQPDVVRVAPPLIIGSAELTEAADRLQTAWASAPDVAAPVSAAPDPRLYDTTGSPIGAAR
jgi:acetylornithine/N-succinyldiaminopimelate aminotransferase